MPFISGIIGAIGAAVSAVGSFLGPIAGALGGLGAVGKALLGIGLNLAAAAVQRALAKKALKKQPTGVELELQLGEDVPRKVVCGRFATAGHLVYANSHGAANSFLQQVYVLSDFYTTALDKVWIDGVEATFGDEDETKGKVVASGDYANLIWIKFHDGRQSAADAGLVAGANPEDRWSADHLGIGISYAIVTLLYDRERLAHPPQFLFEGRGAPLYDPRKDSTVGGSGDHRWDDVATWEYSANPVLIDYCYRRGFEVNGDLFCGMAMPATDLPLDKYATAANICDEDVDGRTRYVCSIALDCEADHGDNIEAIMKSCGGIVVNAVGGSYPIIGTDQPIVATLTDEDLVIGAPVSFRARRPMDQIVNSVSGTYPNPENQWAPAGYERATSSVIEAIDRRTLDVQINFETVPDGEQAAQLASIYLSENRFEATAQITVRPRWQVLEAGDWIEWDSARYGSRVYMVTDTELASLESEGPRNVLLSLQERDGSIYDGVGVTVPPVPLGPATPVYQAELQDFAVVAVLGQGTDTRVYPAIRVSWSLPSDPTVASAILQWRIKDQPDVVLDRTVPAASQTVAIIADGVLSLTVYEVRHKIVADPPRVTAWSAWEEVTTLDGASSDVIVSLAQVRSDIRQRFQSLQRDLDAVVTRMTDLATSAKLSGLANYQKISEVFEEVGQAKASILLEQEVRASEDEALAAELQTLTAQLGTVSSTLATEQVVRATADDALALSISTMQSEIDDVSADLTTEQTTRATADTALANSLTTLNSNLTTEISNRQAGDTANTTAINTVSANLLTEQTTRASADSALSSSITAVNADYNGRFASGLVQFAAQTAPGGIDARFSVGLRAGTGDSFKYAGFYLDLRTVGGTQRSEFAVVADRFSVWDGSNSTYPFTFVGGVLYAQGLKVQWADIVNVSIGTAQIANGAITSAKIGSLEVGESNINYSSITGQSSASNSISVAGDDTWKTIATLTIANPSQRYALLQYTLSQTASTLSGLTGSRNMVTRLRRTNDNAVVDYVEANLAPSTPGNLNASKTVFVMDVGAAGFSSVTYALESKLNNTVSGATASGSIYVLWGKR